MPGAVPDGAGTENLTPLGVAGQAVHLALAPAANGKPGKAVTTVALFDQGVIQVLQASVTGLEPKRPYVLALAETVANPLILSLIDSIVGLLREQRIKIFNVEGGPQRGQIHHKRILEAMERRDAEMARTAMRSHLEQVREDSKASPGSQAVLAGKRAPASSKAT